jgi:hypothetical protein
VQVLFGPVTSQKSRAAVLRTPLKEEGRTPAGFGSPSPAVQSPLHPLFASDNLFTRLRPQSLSDRGCTALLICNQGEDNDQLSRTLADVLSLSIRTDELPALLIEFLKSERRQFASDNLFTRLRPQSLSDRGCTALLICNQGEVPSSSRENTLSPFATDYPRQTEDAEGFGKCAGAFRTRDFPKIESCSPSYPFERGSPDVELAVVQTLVTGLGRRYGWTRASETRGSSTFLFQIDVAGPATQQELSREVYAKHREVRPTGLRLSISNTSPLDELVRGLSPLPLDSRTSIEVQDVVNHSHSTIIRGESLDKRGNSLRLSEESIGTGTEATSVLATRGSQSTDSQDSLRLGLKPFFEKQSGGLPVV